MATLMGQPYPRERLNEGWRLILTNQFHDVIPGSSIREVYEDSLIDYERITAIGEAVLNESIQAIAKQVPLADGEDGLLLFHTAGVESHSQLVELPAGSVPDDAVPVNAETGLALPIQRSAAGTFIQTTLQPGMGWQLLRFQKGDTATAPVEYPSQGDQPRASEHALENRYFRIALNVLGEITSLYDKTAQREVLPAGTVGNQLQAFEDRPARWDAWDIDITYDDKLSLAEPESISVVESGPLRATVEVRKTIMGSPVIQHISLSAFSPRIDFRTTIEWRARHTLLKVAFPVDVLSPRATFDIQFGNVERPTHRNTSWDWARFETVGHKWVDLSEGNYGVSLLNDCKYGHDVSGNVLRLSLLRAATFPDPEADQGEQVFQYSLLPHATNSLAGTISEAYDLNDPVLAVPVKGNGGTKFAALESLLSIQPQLQNNSAAVIIETVKGAEDGRGIVVRLYETMRFRSDVALVSSFPIAKAWETNLMEKDEQPLEIVNGKEIMLHFTPFQIRTLRLIPA